MPQFRQGESKKALIAMSNPTGSPFDYDVVLYMGTNMVAMANTSFHLEAGESKNVELPPITMPSALGTYPVYLDALSGGALLGHYKAVEDVVIVEAPLIKGEFLDVWCEPTTVSPGETVTIHVRWRNIGEAGYADVRATNWWLTSENERQVWSGISQEVSNIHVETGEEKLTTFDIRIRTDKDFVGPTRLTLRIEPSGTAYTWYEREKYTILQLQDPYTILV